MAHRIFVLGCSFTMLAGCSLTHAADFPVLKGLYLGQSPPGDSAELFAPGIVSTPHHEHSAAVFSPDGTELFWTVMMMPLQSPVPGAIMHMRYVDGRWTHPEVASFSGQYPDGVAFFSPDGSKLYLTSQRPVAGSGAPQDKLDLWVVTRTDGGWSSPTRLEHPINTPNHETSAQVTRSGNLYFLGHYPGVRGNYGIYRSRPVGDRYESPEPLGPTINTKDNDWCPYVDPDERFIIFSSNRPGGLGGLDLYISFATDDGGWGEAVNLGPTVNSEDNDRFPCVSPDGKYLFFLSKRTPLPDHFQERQTHARMLEMSRSITNGLSNIYWVDAGILQRMKPETTNASKAIDPGHP